MKVLFVLVLALMSKVSFAADSSSGCGAGWYILKKNSLLSSWLRSTTHAFLPNSFSMTSGTSNCAKHSIVMKNKRSLHFVEANYDLVQTEMARGQGEFVMAFAQTFDCNVQGTLEFSEIMKNKFDAIYPSVTIAAEDIVKNVQSEILISKVLQASCSGV